MHTKIRKQNTQAKYARKEHKKNTQTKHESKLQAKLQVIIQQPTYASNTAVQAKRMSQIKRMLPKQKRNNSSKIVSGEKLMQKENARRENPKYKQENKIGDTPRKKKEEIINGNQGRGSSSKKRKKEDPQEQR